MRLNLLTIILIDLVVVFSSCKGGKDKEQEGIPDELIIGLIPNQEDPTETLRKSESLGKFLGKKLGVKVKFIKATDYTTVIEAIAAKKIHIAFLSPFSYVIASQKVAIEPIVLMGVKGKPEIFRSLIITSKNSGIKSMEDVKKKAATLTLAFSDPASTSGHLMPRSYLKSIGLDPKNSFKNVLFASSHAASILTTSAGRVDLGCTYDTALERYFDLGKVNRDDLVILWHSEPLAGNPITIRSDLDRKFIQKVQKAFLDFPIEEPVEWAAYKSQYYINDTTFTYIPAKASLYENVRKLAEEMKNLKL
jgi:phosphonate transport system substrate-binding protein